MWNTINMWNYFMNSDNHDQPLRPYFLPWVSKNKWYVSTIQSLFLIVLTYILLFFYLKFDSSSLKI